MPKPITRFSFSTKTILIIASLLFILSFVLLCTTLFLQSKAITSYQPSKPLSIGQTISIGSVSIKLSNLRYSNGTVPFTAPAGSQYAIVAMGVTNRSDKPIDVLPSNDTYAKSKAGEISYLSPTSLESPFRAGQLPAGETITGELSYLVKKDTNYGLYIDSIWSGKVVSYAL